MDEVPDRRSSRGRSPDFNTPEFNARMARLIAETQGRTADEEAARQIALTPENMDAYVLGPNHRQRNSFF